MRFGTGKILGALALALILLAALAPSVSSAYPPKTVRTSIERSHQAGATASVAVTSLTIAAGPVDNRINVFIDPAGRLTLTAPEGLADPDGPTGTNCTLDNPQAGASMATQISCAPSYVQVIVGDLDGGNDSFTAAPDLPVRIGDVSEGLRRPLAGGLGDDRIVAGANGDLLDGGFGSDSLLGNGGEDLLSGGGGNDKLGGGGARDSLYGGGGADKLGGGGARDLCSGGVGRDSGKSCEIIQSIP